MSDVKRRLINLVNDSCFARGNQAESRMQFAWELLQEIHEHASLEEVRAKAAALFDHYRCCGRDARRHGYVSVVHILSTSCA